MNSYGYLGDGITFIFLGFWFVWQGRRNKYPEKKILGMSYRLFMSLGGVIVIIYGINNLIAGGWL